MLSTDRCSPIQALSKRIHYCKYTAQSKYQSNTEEFDHLIESNDVEGVRALLSDTCFDCRAVMEAKLKGKRGYVYIGER